ncbi:sensor histidine kinase [Amphritea japonica]|uniref:histidine kinase n=1 Tax=Amphritea japonica ATCC BAA-1530 TaxID=1278309 RepID=A0A7R6P0U5_9GAMM|nr:HAMP domain-containing sensor histidine kinase [Amphritea japonica]BBB24754.1 two-component system, OmpR family, sensor histidine kinase CpxA [Amphritea japonica ATCC BAA-1530]
MKIRWYKRLFLKIFMTVWLTSFLVIALTAFVIGHLSEQERYRDVLSAKALGQAELLVDRYERTGRLPSPKPPRDRRHFHNDRDDHQERRYFPPKLQIQEKSSGQVIYGTKDEREFRNPMVLSLVSDTRQEYRVVVETDIRPTLVAKLFGFFLSVQIVLLIVVAGIAALLISLMVVRPVNRLRQYTRDLYTGDLSARTDDCLSRRGDEIGELSREFNRMAEYVEQTLQSNQHLLQDVSHELRAPLARLQMAAGLAGQHLPEEDREYIERINLECDRINRLIDEILSLSRLEQMEVSDQDFALNSVIDTLAQDYQFSAAEHPLIWTPVDYRLKGNPALLERALNNILGNAVKHTPEGTEICISAEQLDGKLSISVEDKGPGLSQEQLDKMFKPFVRFTEQQNGYGLGLSIAQRAVQLLGGSLSARSKPGAGLTLLLEFPL